MIYCMILNLFLVLIAHIKTQDGIITAPYLLCAVRVRSPGEEEEEEEEEDPRSSQTSR